MEKFRQLKLNKCILKVIEEAGFKEPSEIQEKTIPLILEGRDVLGSSATGSGKTLAFGAGIIEKINKGKGIQALILTPTRELAEQDALNLRTFSHYSGLNVKEVYGGVSIEPQIWALKKADIVVGTPGRILDHLNRGTLNLEKIRFLVLDEADRMLEMGFIDDVKKIINKCPKERQTLLFSATISSDIEKIASGYMKNPICVEVENYVSPSKLHQVFYDVPQDMKFSLLAHLLKKEKGGLVMVFCNTRRNTNLLAKNLGRYNIHALAIHGGLSQNKRTNIIRAFHSRETLILVCTDVAARGLDIKDISHIYNYDVPKNSTEYIHRIGRTARAGKEGIAVSLVSPRDYENLRKVCEDSSLKINNEPLPEVEYLPVSFSTHSGRGFSEGRHKDRRRQRDRLGANRQRGRFRRDNEYKNKPFGNKRFGGKRNDFGNRRQNRRFQGRF